VVRCIEKAPRSGRIGRAPFRFAYGLATGGWPTEPVWDRSVRSAKVLRLAERAQLGSVGQGAKETNLAMERA